MMMKSMRAVTSKKRKWPKILVGNVLLVSLMGMIGWQMFCVSVGKNSAEGILYDNASHDTVQESIDGMQELGIDVIQYEKDYGAQRFFIEGEDGYQVPVSLFALDENRNRNTVILLHGETGDRTTTYEAAEVFLKNGWNVLAMDQRNSGLSDFSYITFGYLESRDLQACVDYLETIAPGKLIGAHGQSMGAATIGMYLGTKHAAEHLDFAIIDSSYDNMTSMLKWGLDNRGIDAPLPFVASCCSRYMKKHFGFTLEDVDIVKSMETNAVPTLVIQGTQDSLVLPYMGPAIYQAIPKSNSKSELWEIDCGHVEGVHVMPEVYEAKMIEFIDTVYKTH